MQQLVGNKSVNVRKLYGVVFSPILLMLCSFTNNVFAQSSPSFTGGAMQNFSVCMNSTASISTLLSVDDVDVSETETWSVLITPANGTLSGFTTSVTSTGATVTPAGVSYTPGTGYTGTDTFVIEVNDGTFTANTTIVVTVRPVPTLISTTTPAGICDNATFFYTPASSVSGSSFSWSRSFVPGIANAAASGGGTIAEILDNTTYYPIAVTYKYTVSAAGCSSTRNVVVNVSPAPSLQSKTADTACNGSLYSYTPVIGSTGATYTWERAVVTGISPTTSSGSGPISEILSTALTVPVNVVYSFTITASGCTGISNLNVTVVPAPPVTTITTASPSTVCAGTGFQNFGAGIAPPSGVTFSWSAVNAIVNAVGSGDQYSLISFPNPGSASVTLHIGGANALCVSNSTYNVTVGASGPSAAPVIYYNYQFIYQDNTQDTYQWGYDNAATLDSSVIPGATFQSYPITTPDFLNKYYWVITTKSGCMQKTYYNLPLAITNVHTGLPASIDVFPNPANTTVDVAVNNLAGEAEIELANILGQTVKSKKYDGKNIQLDISDLSAGCYVVSCSQNGLKVATARIIKN